MPQVWSIIAKTFRNRHAEQKTTASYKVAFLWRVIVVQLCRASVYTLFWVCLLMASKIKYFGDFQHANMQSITAHERMEIVKLIFTGYRNRLNSKERPYGIKRICGMKGYSSNKSLLILSASSLRRSNDCW